MKFFLKEFEKILILIWSICFYYLNFHSPKLIFKESFLIHKVHYYYFFKFNLFFLFSNKQTASPSACWKKFQLYNISKEINGNFAFNLYILKVKFSILPKKYYPNRMRLIPNFAFAFSSFIMKEATLLTINHLWLYS